ncbi:MAG: cation:proton antiporter [Hadesarchaea archaeon]|nr:cation:proton antiporter [Hadesarchaea archaeon]
MAVEISQVLPSVLLYLGVILIAAKLGGVLAAKIRQPGVLGELVAGIMIGPSVAGWLSQRLFGTALFINLSSEAGVFMDVLAQIGIILLLFLAGLSIDVEEFKKSGKPAAIVAATGVITAFLLGFGVASLLNWAPLEAAFVGAILAATSVGITVRTLMDVHGLHTRVGMTILGAAVIDDVIAIVILGVLGGLAFGGLTSLGLAENIALIALFFIVVLFIGFKTMPRLLTFVGRLRVEEVTLSIALAVVFLIGALAERIRIAALTGAFVAGLVMSRSPVAESLRAKVLTVGYGLFIPIFFVAMGARTDLGALTGACSLAVALAIIAMFDKVVGCGIGALASGFGVKDSLRVGVGMMPRAEIALVIAAMGASTGVIGAELLSMAVMVVLVTSLITPVLVKLAFKEAPPEKK